MFEGSGIVLPLDATTMVELEGSRWRITDGDQSYIARREGEVLNLYRSAMPCLVKINE